MYSLHRRVGPDPSSPVIPASSVASSPLAGWEDSCPTRPHTAPPHAEGTPASLLACPCTAGPSGARRVAVHESVKATPLRPAEGHPSDCQAQWVAGLVAGSSINPGRPGRGRKQPPVPPSTHSCFTPDRAAQAELPKAPGSLASGAPPTWRLLPWTPHGRSASGPHKEAPKREVMASALRKGQRCVVPWPLTLLGTHVILSSCGFQDL